MANLSENRDDFLRNVFPGIAFDFANNEQDRGRLVEIAEWAGPKHDVFFKVVYPRMRALGWTLQDEAPWRDLAEKFKREGERLDWRLSDTFCEEVFKLVDIFHKPFGELLAYFGEFYEGSGDRLAHLVNAHYATASPDLAPLKNVATTLYGFGDDALLRFGQGMDWNVILAHYRQKGDVEAKVLVVRGLSGHFESEKTRIVDALGLTKQEVDAFLEGEFARPDQRTAYLYYGFEGYGLVGTDEEKKELLKRFDFDKLMAQDQIGLEVFGFLEAMQAPFETWDRAIAAFKVDLSDLDAVEKTRQKLLGVTREKANQVIEAKAQEYIEEPITPQNIDAKVAFAKNWSNPKIEVGYGLDERFVLDVYRVPGERMRAKLREHYASNLMKGFEALGIFNEAEIEEINKSQAALREVARARATRAATPSAAPVENPDRVARVATMREWVLNHSKVAEVNGMIQNSVQLEERLVLYAAYQQQGLENRLPLIREQVVSYVNRHPEALTESVTWKGKRMALETVLPECGIALVSSADNAGSRGAKLMDPNVPFDYKTHKVKEKIDYNSRQAKEGLFGLQPATVQGGLHFESGFTGGGEHYEGGRVVLGNESVQPSARLYTIERDGAPEAVVIQFDPQKGARFDFEVQVGAATTGSKANLAHELKKQHGDRLIMDTVGSMVQGEGMPISMIFKDGEPQNKKTTMEGQRDGMVVFSPSGRMGVMDKTSIRYSDFSDIVNLKSFGTHLEGEIKKLEDKLYAGLSEGAALNDTTLETLTRDNPAAVRQYANLVALKERYDLWKQGKSLNYADQYSYVSQDLFWMISRYFKLSGFLESLFVKNGQSQVKEPGSGAHKRLLLEFDDGTYGIYDSRVPLNNKEVAERIVSFDLDGKHVRSAVNLDTGMADDTRVYDKEGNPHQIGYTSQPMGTNRIGIYQKND